MMARDCGCYSDPCCCAEVEKWLDKRIKEKRNDLLGIYDRKAKFYETLYNEAFDKLEEAQIRIIEKLERKLHMAFYRLECVDEIKNSQGKNCAWTPDAVAVSNAYREVFSSELKRFSEELKKNGRKRM